MVSNKVKVTDPYWKTRSPPKLLSARLVQRLKPKTRVFKKANPKIVFGK